MIDSFSDVECDAVTKHALNHRSQNRSFTRSTQVLPSSDSGGLCEFEKVCLVSGPLQRCAVRNELVSLGASVQVVNCTSSSEVHSAAVESSDHSFSLRHLVPQSYQVIDTSGCVYYTVSLSVLS